MKKIKGVTTNIDVDSILVILQFCELETFQNVLLLNKFINNKIKKSYIDCNIVFKFREFPNESQRYVNILEIRGRSYKYFDYLNFGVKISRFFDNLKEVRIVDGGGFVVNIKFIDDDFMKVLSPLPKKVNRLCCRNVHFAYIKPILSKNIIYFETDYPMYLNKKELDLSVYNFEVLKMVIEIFTVGNIIVLPKTLIKLSVEIELSGSIECGYSYGIITKLLRDNVYKLPKLEYLSLTFDVRITPPIDLSLLKVKYFSIKYTAFKRNEYDLRFINTEVYSKSLRSIKGKSKSLQKLCIKFQDEYDRKNIILSTTRIVNKYRKRNNSLREAKHIGCLAKNSKPYCYKCYYANEIKSKMCNVKSILFLIRSEKKNIFYYIL